LSEAKSGTASPHFAEPVLGLAEGETRGLNAGYEAMARGVIRDTRQASPSSPVGTGLPAFARHEPAV